MNNRLIAKKLNSCQFWAATSLCTTVDVPPVDFHNICGSHYGRGFSPIAEFHMKLLDQIVYSRIQHLQRLILLLRIRCAARLKCSKHNRCDHRLRWRSEAACAHCRLSINVLMKRISARLTGVRRTASVLLRFTRKDDGGVGRSV